MCARICPKEAMALVPAESEGGRLQEKPRIEIDAQKCTFCGECVIVCPINAIRTEKNGKVSNPVFENAIFPTIRKAVTVDTTICSARECKLECRDSCPTKAVEVIIGCHENRKTVEVKVDQQHCIFCKRCEAACPHAAVRVEKPIEGLISLNTKHCPKSCQVCIDVCPSKAIELKGGKPLVIDEFCIYCGVCQEACPEKVIEVKRSHIGHSDVKSAAWNVAFEKLTSHICLVKKLNTNKTRSRLNTVQGCMAGRENRLVPTTKKEFVFADPSKCTGCSICELVCALENENVFDPAFSRMKVIRLSNIMNFSAACRLCEEPACVSACPKKALKQSDKGTIIVDEEKCDGCKWCITACEHGAITLHPKKKSVLVCNLCGDKEKPRCVEWCPEGALELRSATEPGVMLLSEAIKKLSKGPENYEP